MQYRRSLRFDLLQGFSKFLQPRGRENAVWERDYTYTQGFSENMAAGSTQPGQPVFVAAGTRPRVVVPASAGTQPPVRQFLVPHPLVATNSPSPQPVSSKGQ